MKTTETIKEQRQRREARRDGLIQQLNKVLAIEAQAEYHEIIIAANEKTIADLKSGRIAYKGDDIKPPQTPLYKPKAGMRVITKPDVSFVVSQAYGCSVFLLDGERVLIKEATQELIFGKFVLKEVVFEFIDSKNKKLKAAYISEGLIYCEEYEMEYHNTNGSWR